MRFFFVLVINLVFIANSFAKNGDLESCYTKKMKMEDEFFNTELFVLVDQTTLFNSSLKNVIATNIRPFLKPGDGVTVIKFSAYKQGKYTDVLASIKLSSNIDENMRADISKRLLKEFDRCVSSQVKKSNDLVGVALRSAFGQAENQVDKSDILFSLKATSVKVKKSHANRKIVLLASDMLENSSITSFYNKRAVRRITPEQEITAVEKHNLIGDFGGAEVYVVGAGLLAEDAKNSDGAYRPYQVMKPLEEFWSKWFEKSNAKLVEFGQPALLNPIE